MLFVVESVANSRLWCGAGRSLVGMLAPKRCKHATLLQLIASGANFTHSEAPARETGEDRLVVAGGLARWGVSFRSGGPAV
jgi:hypothetical protein